MKRGFTLIELLAVIVILAIIALIAVPIVLNIINDAKKSSQEESFKLYTKAIENAVTNYLMKNPSTDPTTLKLNNIKDYIKYSGEDIECETLQIGEKGEIYLANCTVSGAKIEHIYGEKLYPKPELTQGLTPVIYDGDNWKIVDKKDKNWYDYDEQKWANAVVLKSGLTKTIGDTVTVEGNDPDILMMYVWIPRYEYKIEGQYGKHSDGTVGTQELPGEIKVNFISKNTTVPTEGYHINSAFTFDGEKSGFWVGKFELSHTTRSYSSCNCTTINCSEAQNLRIIPGKSSLKTNTVSSYWYGIKSIENTALFGFSNIDIHMMKNSEWGAVAYLSQSKYGKYGNKDYEGYQKEVYINNSVYDYTGRSGGNPGGSTPVNETYVDQSLTDNYSKYGYYTYDGYLLNYDTNTKTEKRDINKGAGASTTGNIYGVYDMSGGAWEYVMGAYGTEEDGVYSGYTISSNSGFNGRTGNDSGNVTTALSLPDLKYYDMYTNATNRVTNDGSLSCKNGSEYGVCYGHAISETGGWYKDYNNVVIPSHPWFGRGGYYNFNASAGVFDRTVHNGDYSDNATTRVVGIVKK